MNKFIGLLLIVWSVIFSWCSSSQSEVTTIDDRHELPMNEFDKQAKQLIDNLDKEEIVRLREVWEGVTPN